MLDRPGSGLRAGQQMARNEQRAFASGARLIPSAAARLTNVISGPAAQAKTSTADLRRRHGRELRRSFPRSVHGTWAPPADRPDPVELLDEQDSRRIAELIPIRHERMSESPFAFFRGAAAVMAEDLASTPASGLLVQACGDAHLLNFGVFATPERTLVFDVNDYDETLPAPFEWDVKRMAASAVVAGRGRGFSPEQCVSAAVAAARSYRKRITEAARMGHLEVWYRRLAVDDLVALVKTARGRALGAKVVRTAQRSTSLGALGRLTEVVDGRLRIIDNRPLIEHLPDRPGRLDGTLVVERYRRSLAGETRAVLDRYHVIDWARKVVGVGSVGTDDAIVLLMGDSASDPLFLQAKEAQASVLERHAGASCYANHGQRVVAGQRLMQAASDICLGWTAVQGRHYYVRQLRDMKGSVPVEKLSASELAEYSDGCGAALADGHARSGDPVAIAGYLGAGAAFEQAIGRFAVAYGDQVEGDYACFARRRAN
jgi:uncharacterized protein (DUF2252 family)